MSTPSPQDALIHHVLFYAKPDASPADQAKLLEGLQTMTQIPGIKAAHIGTPAGTTREVIDRTYAYSWLCIFGSHEAEQYYQQHPIHDAFREQYARYWDRVVIYDAVGALYGAAPALPH